MSKKTKIIIGVLCLLALFAIVQAFFLSKTTTISMCVVSGAYKQEFTLFGFSTSISITDNALSNWIKRKEGAIDYQWQFCNEASSDLFGIQQRRACGSVPAIYDMIFQMDEFIKRSSDAEISDFVKQMRVLEPIDRRELIDGIIYQDKR